MVVSTSRLVADPTSCASRAVKGIGALRNADRPSISRPSICPSAIGMAKAYVTGDKSTWDDANVSVEKANVKEAAAKGELPDHSLETLKGKAQTAAGMVTGDQELQREGNVRTEKAAWIG